MQNALHNRATSAAQLAWAAYTARPWALAADVVIIAALIGGALWIL